MLFTLPTNGHLFIYLIFSIFFGASIGSFLNVCILRIPRKMSLSNPNSHCYQCGSYLKAYDNIPIFGYFILGGKCRYCGITYSFSYAWIEILMAILSPILLIYCIEQRNIEIAQYLLLIIICALLVVASCVDVNHQMIPDKITLPYLTLIPLCYYFFPHLFRFNSELPLIIRHFNNHQIIIIIAALSTFLLLSYFKLHMFLQVAKQDILFFIIFMAFQTFIITLLVLSNTNLSWATLPPSFVSSILGLTISVTLLISANQLIHIFTSFTNSNASSIFGAGDIKLVGMICAFFGINSVLPFLFIWLLYASVFGGIYLVKIAFKFLPSIEKILSIFLLSLLISSAVTFFANYGVLELSPYTYAAMFGFTLGLFGLFLFIKNWIDMKIVPSRLPMAFFISLAALTYFFFKENNTEKVSHFLKFFE